VPPLVIAVQHRTLARADVRRRPIRYVTQQIRFGRHTFSTQKFARSLRPMTLAELVAGAGARREVADCFDEAKNEADPRQQGSRPERVTAGDLPTSARLAGQTAGHLR
jgi:hypothetical protein